MHIIINAGKIMLQWQLKQKTPFLSLKKKVISQLNWTLTFWILGLQREINIAYVS